MTQDASEAVIVTLEVYEVGGVIQVSIGQENENGVGAPMLNPIQLCGSSFGLGVRRHRLFESNQPLFSVPCRHDQQPEPIDVTGTGGPATKPRPSGGGIHRKPRDLDHAREVMGIDWMSRRELSQAVPPAYTEFIGRQLIEQMERVA